MGTPGNDRSLRWMRPSGRSDSGFRRQGPSGVRAIIPENARLPRKRRIGCGFVRFSARPRREHDRLTWRPLAHDTAKPGASSRLPARAPTRLADARPARGGARRSPSPVAGAADETVTLNFVNADIESVVKAVAEITGRNFVIDPRVKGTVNIISARPVPKSLVYPTLLSALRLQGFAAVEGDGVVKIVPEADAKQQGGAVAVGAVGAGGDRLVTQVITLRYESAPSSSACCVRSSRRTTRSPRTRAATRWSSPTMRTISGGSNGSSRRSTSRPAASRSSSRSGTRRRSTSWRCSTGC